MVKMKQTINAHVSKDTQGKNTKGKHTCKIKTKTNIQAFRWNKTGNWHFRDSSYDWSTDWRGSVTKALVQTGVFL